MNFLSLPPSPIYPFRGCSYLGGHPHDGPSDTLHQRLCPLPDPVGETENSEGGWDNICSVVIWKDGGYWGHMQSSSVNSASFLFLELGLGSINILLL